ncbi:MAG: hypothetical protein BGO69_19420 [Bacteroidetes bacterium 46-16]|nr:MAG: hypothetical protein BGO69_19420 [Bacteroidetes bacterium 46-16]
MSFRPKNAPNLILFIIALITTLVYSNHFNNSFHFDDAHTIVNNLSIRDIHNIPVFFTDGRTMSSLPSNQDYRPGLTTLNAIDFYLSGKTTPDPFVFHVSVFASFILLGLLFYILLLNILTVTANSVYNKWTALFITAWFWLHPANAETINYIIARGDSFSTLCIILAFVLYIKLPNTRIYYLYMLPVIIGFFVKEPAIMFVPLLFCYKLFFEQEMSLRMAISKPARSLKLLIPLGIPFLIVIGLFVFSRKMAPDTWVPGGYDKWRYLFTQPAVIFHYCNNFLLPFNLVVDTDWTLVPSYTDEKVINGLLFVIVLLVITYLAAAQKKWRPVAFGILWFFIALAPTSSIFPFAEVLNDHRTFFPYLGLFIAVAATGRNLLDRYTPRIQKPMNKSVLLVTAFLLLTAYAYGTYKRNEVWHTEETLWKDATIKAPANARAWMNYGNTQMAKGNFAEAEKCFEKAITLSPYYAYVYVNMGVLKAAQGDRAAAEPYFKKALELDPGNPECYAFYAEYLIQGGRNTEAGQVLEKGLAISPAHEKMNQLMQQNQKALNAGTTITIAQSDERLAQIAKWTTAHPSPENYLTLSLEYYSARQFENCIRAAQQALQLRPCYDLAYNNICAAYNQLQQWDNAVDAGKKGLECNPGNPNLKANLEESYKGRQQ